MILKNILGKVRKTMGQEGKKKKKRQGRKSNGSKQKNETGDSKVESNDSPEIPDRRETSDIHSRPPFGAMGRLEKAPPSAFGRL